MASCSRASYRHFAIDISENDARSPHWRTACERRPRRSSSMTCFPRRKVPHSSQSFASHVRASSLVVKTGNSRGEAPYAFSEILRKVLGSHPRGFLDIGLVEDGAFLHGPDGFLVKRCSGEVGKDQDRTARSSGHDAGKFSDNRFDLGCRTF